MSIIVSVNKNGRRVMAADSLVTLGERRIPAEVNGISKIRTLGGALLAVAGWNVYDDVLTDYMTSQSNVSLATRSDIFRFFNGFWQALHKDYAFVNDSVDAADSPFGSLDSTFLVHNSTGIFLVTSDMGVLPFDRFYAIGSGATYALGALEALYDNDLDAEQIARGAVDIAIKMDVSCGAPVVAKQVPEE
jgi:ATP-dependent protease HslVU (ClpYQ) peptidase subunit